MSAQIKLKDARYMIVVPGMEREVIIELCNCSECNGYLKGPPITVISEEGIRNIFSEFAKQVFDASIGAIEAGCDGGDGLKRWGAQILKRG